MNTTCASPFCSAAAVPGKNFCETHSAELSAFSSHKRLKGSWTHMTPPGLEAAIFAAREKRERGLDKIVEVVHRGKLLAQWEKGEKGYDRVPVKAGKQPMTVEAQPAAIEAQSPESGAPALEITGALPAVDGPSFHTCGATAALLQRIEYSRRVPLPSAGDLSPRICVGSVALLQRSRYRRRR
jgi:hypothetical protein